MTTIGFRGGLHPIYLHKTSLVTRGLSVPCPICRELSGQPCKMENGKPVVHDARESFAFHGKKIWV